uniref:Uncharacterized protein n=1 Tax=Chaetoceros debilis TaxID=122233 RepID=A0A7S3Q7L1_9STRA
MKLIQKHTFQMPISFYTPTRISFPDQGSNGDDLLYQMRPSRTKNRQSTGDGTYAMPVPTLTWPGPRANPDSLSAIKFKTLAEANPSSKSQYDHSCNGPFEPILSNRFTDMPSSSPFHSIPIDPYHHRIQNFYSKTTASSSPSFSIDPYSTTLLPSFIHSSLSSQLVPDGTYVRLCNVAS